MEGSRNNSRKRSAIYETLCRTKEHPTAEMLCSMVRSEIPELSLATVYRNLSLLEEDGLVRIIGNVNGQARYDARTDLHPHFVCRVCGHVQDLELPDPSAELYSEISSRYGALPEAHSLNFYGLCADCRSR